jgi:hypothetical protein
MPLIINGNTISTVVKNKQRAVQNEYIIRNRNLNATLLTQKVINTDKIDEIIELEKVSYADLTILRNLQGTNVTCSLTGFGSHNFSGTYNLEIEAETEKSFDGYQNLRIILHKT